MGQHSEARHQGVAVSIVLLGLCDWSVTPVLDSGVYVGKQWQRGGSFLADLHQAKGQWLGSAFLGGVIFNLSNILLVAAIDIAGMAVAFPVGVGLALVLGVITTYIAKPQGNAGMLALGVAGVTVAIVLDALAYKRLTAKDRKTPAKGIALSVAAGLLMGLFYSYVARAMGEIKTLDGVATLETGKLSPYTAIVVVFSRCGPLKFYLEHNCHDQTVFRRAGAAGGLFQTRQPARFTALAFSAA